MNNVLDKLKNTRLLVGIGKKIKDINNPKASLVPTFLGAAFAIYLILKLDVEFSNYSLGFY